MEVSAWDVRSLAEISTMISGGTPSKSEPKYWSGDIPWISASSMTGIELATSDRMVTTEAIGNGTRIAAPGSTLVLVRGMSLLREVKLGHASREMAFNQDVKALFPKQGIDDWFLTFALKAQESVLLDSVHLAGHGTGVLASSVLQGLSIPIPDLGTQKRIARVLRDFNELIDQNLRLSLDLDDLFVLSIVDLEDDIASTALLGDLVELNKGLSYKGEYLSSSGLPMISLASFGLDGRHKRSGEKFYIGPVRENAMLEEGDLVVANTDLTQRRELIARPLLVPYARATSTHHTFQIRTEDKARKAWIYGLLRSDKRRELLAAFSTGTTVSALPKDALANLSLPWPLPSQLTEWWAHASFLLSARKELLTEVSELEKARDELLPLLMSGEAEVRDLESENDASN